ncbi:MAG: LytTR family DNA-binding domain-containing protein [Acidobacteriota bacterium]
MTRARVVIAEDEPLARAQLRRLIGETDWLELAGEAGDGGAAVTMIDRLQPDLLFLDVVMPEKSGLEVLEEIRHRPLVVFTTAHDRYAVPAFELEALDYLVKPFGARRFAATLERVRRQLHAGKDVGNQAERAREAVSKEPLRRVFARSGHRIVPIVVSRATRFEAAGDYVKAHVEGETHLLQVSLDELERRLDPRLFQRVHRSHIVNLDRMLRMEDSADRRLEIFLRDGTRVTASRAGSSRLKKLIR